MSDVWAHYPTIFVDPISNLVFLEMLHEGDGGAGVVSLDQPSHSTNKPGMDKVHCIFNCKDSEIKFLGFGIGH